MKKFITYSLMLVCFSVFAEEQASPVKVLPLQQQTLSESITAWGKVEQDLQQLYFEIGGYVDDILVDEGTKVKKDQVLAHLDSELLENQRQQAQVSLKHAKRKLARIKELKRKSAAGQDQLDDVSNDYRLKSLNLQYIQEQYEQYALRAPATGTIIQRYLDYPGSVSATTAVFSFKAQNQPWLITVNVAARYLHKLQLGNSAEVIFTAFPQQAISGKLHKIAADSNSTDNLFEVEIALDETPNFIRAGMQVKAHIKTVQTTGYTIPLNAFYRLNGQQGSLFLIKQGDDKAYDTQTEFAFVQGTNAIVTSDLSAFNAVVIAGQQHLKAGSTIKILDN